MPNMRMTRLGLALAAACLYFAPHSAVAQVQEFQNTTIRVAANETLCALPESAHPYSNNLDFVWNCPGIPGAVSLNVTFDPQTNLVDGQDFLYVTDANGVNIPGSPFTGSTLAGQTKSVPGNKVTLRLVTDSRVVAFGFRVTNIVPVFTLAPDLTISKTHSGNFNPGQSGALYTIMVSNAGGGATSGVVTVTDTLPAGLTATAMTGSGWTCSAVSSTCTRADSLAPGAAYPPISLASNVASNAPANVTNVAAVSGGGESNISNNSASDPTTIASVSSGATIIIVNGDGPGVGFNDATAAAPIGGNTGTTLGQQRLIAFQAAAQKWGATLNSTVPIRVLATWTAMSCSQNSAVLGGASTTEVFRDFQNAPVPNRWYAKAEANKLAGVDLDPTTEDIEATFNVSLGQPGCLPGAPFYLGLDNNGGPDRVDLFAVLLHELAHGLGFLTVTDDRTGARFGGFPSIFDDFLLDNATNKTWSQMTNAERAASAINNGHLVWIGPNVNSAIPQVLTFQSGIYRGADNAGRALMYAPATNQPGSSVSHFDTTMTRNQLMEPSINSDLTHEVTPPQDLTFSLLKDIGWGSTTAQPQSPDLAIIKVHAGTFTQGQIGASYTITVSNTGGSTSGLVTVTEILPAGLTATGMAGTGWSCAQPAGPCTRSDALAGGSSYPVITVTVNVAANAPANVLNTATVSGGGDTNSLNNTASDPTSIGVPQGCALPESAHPYISNFDFTWTCTVAGASSLNITFDSQTSVEIGNDFIFITDGNGNNIAGSPFTGTALAGQMKTVPGSTVRIRLLTNARTNDWGFRVASIAPAGAAPDLAISKTHAGVFAAGQTGAQYSIVVSNAGAGASSGVVTVTENIPTGFTATSMSGSGWTCAQPAGPCVRTDALSSGASYPAITLTGNVAATSPSVIVNVANVTGGGDTNSANNSASDPATVIGSAGADLTITKTHSGEFAQGQIGATYTITVRNAGTGPSSGAVTVTDVLPAGIVATSIAGSGWSCTQPAGPCTRSDALAAGVAYLPITLTVNVASDAPATVVNTAAVSGGGDVNSGNNVATDSANVSGRRR